MLQPNDNTSFLNPDPPFLSCSQTLKMFLDEQDEIPWPALQYVTGDINYGGRVTDDLDRRCIRVILRQYYTPALVESEGYKFSRSGIYS